MSEGVPVTITLPPAVLERLTVLADSEGLSVPDLFEAAAYAAVQERDVPVGDLGDGALVRLVPGGSSGTMRGALGYALTEAGLDLVLAMWRAGATVDLVRSTLEVSTPTARRLLRGQGLLPDPLRMLIPDRQKDPAQAAVWKAALQAYDDGLTVAEVCMKHKLPLSTMYRLLRDNDRQLRAFPSGKVSGRPRRVG